MGGLFPPHPREDLAQFRELIVGVQPAGVRQHPDVGFPDLAFLQSELRIFLLKRFTVGGDPQKDDLLRSVLDDLLRENAGSLK